MSQAAGSRSLSPQETACWTGLLPKLEAEPLQNYLL